MADSISRYERERAKRFPPGSATLLRGALHRANLESANLAQFDRVCDDGEEVVWCRAPPDALFAFASRRSVVVATRERSGTLDLDEARVLEMERRDPKSAEAHCHAGRPGLATATLETRSSWLVFAPRNTTIELLVGSRATKAPPPSARVVRAGKLALMGTRVARGTLDERGYLVLDLGNVSAAPRAALHLIVDGEVLAEGVAGPVLATSAEDEPSVLAAMRDRLQDIAADSFSGRIEPLRLTREGERILWEYLWEGVPARHSVYWPERLSQGDFPALGKALKRGLPSDE